MTAPVWMAFPPEVHSALLNSGPGAGPLLASASAWNSLSSEYTEIAAELSTLVAAVQAGAWQGPSAESYVAANVPYLLWLTQAAADAAATATQQETAAAAYAVAQATMPTLGELTANHATHGVLTATNFFGINTIPIALNEVDYVRMWVQAATTMTAYQGASTAAVAASPRTTAAPTIVRADAAPAAADPFQSIFDFLAQVEQIFNQVGGGQNTDLISYLFSVPPGTDPVTWFVTKINVLSSPTSGYPALLQGLTGAAGNNPVLLAAAYLFGAAAIGYDLAIQALQFLVTFPLLAAGLAPLAAAPALAGLAAGGAVGVGEIALHVHAGAESVPDAPATTAVSPSPGPAPASAAAPAAAAPAAPPAPSAPVPTSAPAAPPAPGAPPPPGGTPAGPIPYLMGGWSAMSSPTTAKASAKRKAPASDIAAAAAAEAAAGDKVRKRRQRRSTVDVRGRGYEYADMNEGAGEDPGPAPSAASDLGAGRLGFTGAARRESVASAAGLARLTGDEFGGGPREPMMPSTWAPEATDDEH